MNIPCSLQLCVIIATIVTLSQSHAGEVSSGSTLFRRMFSGYDKRAITRFDRMGRYYGKRSSPDLERQNTRPVYTVDEFQDMISNSPVVMALLVRGYLDRNGDGLIDEGELDDLTSRMVNL